jgi:hypothetical protein
VQRGEIGPQSDRLVLNPVTQAICRTVIALGNSLTVIGCVGLILGLSGIISVDSFSLGISSGIRIIGSVAIAGCLLSAVGYGVIEYGEH